MGSWASGKSARISGQFYRNTSHLQSHTSAAPGVTPHKRFTGILYAPTTGCSWHDVPAKYCTKSALLCEKGVYQPIFLDLLRWRYMIRKIDLSHCATDTKDIPAKKGDPPVMMTIKW